MFRRNKFWFPPNFPISLWKICKSILLKVTLATILTFLRVILSFFLKFAKFENRVKYYLETFCLLKIFFFFLGSTKLSSSFCLVYVFEAIKTNFRLFFFTRDFTSIKSIKSLKNIYKQISNPLKHKTLNKQLFLDVLWA